MGRIFLFLVCLLNTTNLCGQQSCTHELGYHLLGKVKSIRTTCFRASDKNGVLVKENTKAYTDDISFFDKDGKHLRMLVFNTKGNVETEHEYHYSNGKLSSNKKLDPNGIVVETIHYVYGENGDLLQLDSERNGMRSIWIEYQYDEDGNYYEFHFESEQDTLFIFKNIVDKNKNIVNRYQYIPVANPESSYFPEKLGNDRLYKLTNSEYDKNGHCILTETYWGDGSLFGKTYQHYDGQGNATVSYTVSDNSKPSTVEFDYINFDSFGNWVKANYQTVFGDYIYERRIEYYD